MNYNYDFNVENLPTNSAIPEGLLKFLVGSMVVITAMVIICAIIIIIAQVKMFKKGKQPGWAAIVPFYNQYIHCKMVGVNPWWVLISVVASFVAEVPYVGAIISLVVTIYFEILLGVSTARAFGKDDAFAVGLILLPVVFYPIIGFGKAEYVGAGNPMNDFVFKKGEEIVNSTGNSNKKFCPHCGTKMNNDSKFCPSCGKEVK